jgi:hypothetical protein
MLHEMQPLNYSCVLCMALHQILCSASNFISYLTWKWLSWLSCHSILNKSFSFEVFRGWVQTLNSWTWVLLIINSIFSFLEMRFKKIIQNFRKRMDSILHEVFCTCVYGLYKMCKFIGTCICYCKISMLK